MATKTADQEIFDTESTFADLDLKPEILEALTAMGFEHPTQVQAKLIPVALAGKDVLGQSKTGTGKTAAFAIPVLNATEPGDAFNALVLSPTRELAIQTAHEFRNIGRKLDVKVLPVYGGQRMRIQGPKLEKGPEIIVGTPGRVMDFHGRGALPYDKFRFVILDEVDRMLDIGFRDDIRKILGTIRQKHQTIFVSATISGEIERLARTYMKDPEKLVLTAKSLTVSQVDQMLFHVEPWDKKKLLVHLIKREKPEVAIIFCRTKHTVDGLTSYLQRKNIEAMAIHGDLHQGRRNKVMDKLRSGELKMLVASDLAARGLDVDDVSHVINYDLPEDPEVYVHRIGRTARAGRKGIAWSFATPGQGALVNEIEKLTNVHVPEGDLGSFEPGPIPEAVVTEREREVERRATISDESSRFSRTAPSEDEAKNEAKFPGGIVPSAPPARRLGGRIRTRRR